MTGFYSANTLNNFPGQECLELFNLTVSDKRKCLIGGKVGLFYDV